MDPDIRRLTHKYSIIAAAVSVATHPLPGLDEIATVPVHYHFSVKMAKALRLKIWNVPWMQVHKIVWGGAAFRFFADLAIGYIPVAGAVTHAVSAAALTEVLGQYLYEAMTGKRPQPVTMRSLGQSLRARIAATVSTVAGARAQAR